MKRLEAGRNESARLAHRIWSKWPVRFLAILTFAFFGLSSLPLKSTGIGKPDLSRSLPTPERFDPLKYALSNYSVLGRAKIHRIDSPGLEQDPKFEATAMSDHPERVQNLFMLIWISKSASLNDGFGYPEIRSEKDLRFVAREVLKFEAAHDAFLLRRDHDFFIRLVTLLEALLVAVCVTGFSFLVTAKAAPGGESTESSLANS